MRTLLNQLQRVETVLGLGEEGRGGLVEVAAIPEGALAAYKAMREAWGDEFAEGELLELAEPLLLPEREARLAGLCRGMMAEEGLKFLADPERFDWSLRSIADAEGREGPAPVEVPPRDGSAPPGESAT